MYMYVVSGKNEQCMRMSIPTNSLCTNIIYSDGDIALEQPTTAASKSLTTPTGTRLEGTRPSSGVDNDGDPLASLRKELGLQGNAGHRQVS